MNSTLGSAKTPWHLWLVGILGVLWNGLGATSYTMTQLGMLESLNMSASEISYYDSFPAWAMAVWALGVWGSLFGSIALLLRSRFAVTLFGVSIIGLIGTTIFQWVVSDMPEALSTTGNMIFAGVIWVITLLLFFYSRRMRDGGVLK